MGRLSHVGHVQVIRSDNRGLFKERIFKKGDLVILQEKNVPRSYWPLVRVSKIYPDCGGVVCIVKWRTPKIEIVQPANKLYLMEGSDY